MERLGEVTLAGGSKVVLNTQTAVVSRELADRLEIDISAGELWTRFDRRVVSRSSLSACTRSSNVN